MQFHSRKTDRRHFIAASAVTAATTLGCVMDGSAFAQDNSTAQSKRFNLRFAPHPGSFAASAGKDVIDQINFCHQQGFTAFEYNRIKRESPQKQTEIGDLLAKHEMKMGVFVAYANFDNPTFTNPTQSGTHDILKQVKESIEVAKRCNAKYVTVVPGSVDQPPAGTKGNSGPRLADGYQLANAIDILRHCAEILEPHDLVMVLEPLNWHANHGGAFLKDSDQAYAICRAVNSPSCKILFDIYHQQITEGNLINNIKKCWNEIAYFQAGDNPGRAEPGTGEINYQKVFKAIHDRALKEGKDFIIGMEHRNSIKGKPGDDAVIAAYRKVDPK
jgi:hydroxypyruvate isomerase